MNSKEKKDLVKKIKRAVLISSQKMIQKKKELGQSVVVSIKGEIQIIEAKDLETKGITLD